MSGIKEVIKCIIFLFLLFAVIGVVSDIANPDSKIIMQIELYEDQPTDSISIAFIGNSSTHQFYDVMAIWEEYGITSMSYAINSMPYDLNITMIEYVLENQSPELLVIDLRNLMTEEYNIKYYGMYETELRKESYISALNLFPFSFCKLSSIFESGYIEGERYMQAFSILYNHDGVIDGWNTLVKNDFTRDAYEYKQNGRLLFKVTDMTDSYVVFDPEDIDEEYELTDETKERLLELLEYCEDKELDVYFVFTPYLNTRHKADQDVRNAIVKLVESYGYPISDYKSQIEEIGLDPSTDYWDASHTNVFGANKYTLYAMEEILEEYSITPNYSQEVIDDWNQTYVEWGIYYSEQVANMTEETIESSTE